MDHLMILNADTPDALLPDFAGKVHQRKKYDPVKVGDDTPLSRFCAEADENVPVVSPTMNEPSRLPSESDTPRSHRTFRPEVAFWS